MSSYRGGFHNSSTDTSWARKQPKPRPTILRAMHVPSRYTEYVIWNVINANIIDCCTHATDAANWVFGNDLVLCYSTRGKGPLPRNAHLIYPTCAYCLSPSTVVLPFTGISTTGSALPPRRLRNKLRADPDYRDSCLLSDLALGKSTMDVGGCRWSYGGPSSWFGLIIR